MSEILQFFSELPPFLVYVLLGAGAALENVVPPVPADTFVVLGGFLAAQGRAEPLGVFLATWGANVLSALVVYAAGRKYGRGFFRTGIGHFLLRPHQLARLQSFYDRWGHWAIFLTRFLPGFRAIVPVFAGVTRQPLLPVALPLGVASAIWYGLLTWLGAVTGRNLNAILDWLGHVNRSLLLLALALAVALGWGWYRSRHDEHPDDAGPGE